MIDSQALHAHARRLGIDFFTGVPDSLLRAFCAFLSVAERPETHGIAADEGGAVALATGHYLATGRPALVYLQNSGQGHAMNPLLSICDREVYGIPMVLLVGWRGEPGRPDEPQHRKQGRVTGALFDAMEIPCEILADDSPGACAQLERMATRSRAEHQPVALLVREGTFAPFAPPRGREAPAWGREAAIEALLERIPPAAVTVATTGHIARELYAARTRRGEGHERDFLMIGGMGHASQAALGLALARPDLPVFCFDGDGASLMHLGGMAIVGQSRCANYRHVVLNNGAHGSVGGQPTVALAIRLDRIARACGYTHAERVASADALDAAFARWVKVAGPTFLELLVSAGARADLERPAGAPADLRAAFMGRLHGA